MALHVVILAAGAGTRMNSKLPKVLHALAKTPLLEHVYRTAVELKPAQIHVIYGHRGEEVQRAMSHLNIHWIEQREQLGTGHAVMQILPHVKPQDRVLVLYGDVPLISLETLRALLNSSPADGIGIVSAEMPDPTGLGRVVRDHSGNITNIIEHRDANEKELLIQEIYSGILTAPVHRLAEWLPQLQNNNAQKEYYLTALVPISVHAKCSVIAVLASCPREVEGVNDRFQLADLERYYQQQAAMRVMKAGASLIDPARFDVRGTVEVASDVLIDVNVICEGHVTLGENTVIGPNCILKNARIGKNVTIHANTIIEDAVIADHCQVGPFARIRPGTELQTKSKIGNFVEVKKSIIGNNSKVSHLSYIGDSTLGSNVNIGAGTITCNYDGINKFKTNIENGAFIGSNSVLIAPVTVGENATIAAGTRVIQDAPAEQLTLNPTSQIVKAGWQQKKQKQTVEE